MFPSRWAAAFFAIGLSGTAVLTSGCANVALSGSTESLSGSQGTLSGKLHGGNQPVVGALVRLYAAGTSGYGSAGTLYATTTSSAPDGGFQFSKSATNTGVTNSSGSSWGCPSSGDPQMYLISTGGITQGTGTATNSAAAFAIALGRCSQITSATFVDLNEVTTVATMAALQQYFNPNTESFGAPASTQAQTGFQNGVATISNMVDKAAGAAYSSNTVSATPAGHSASVTVTITPETKKINAIANVLAACVNQTSSSAAQCSTLFASVPAPSPAVTSQPGITFSAPTDVLQAAYFMLSNPASGSAANINAAFGLISADAPFQPSLTTAPTDWSVAIRYDSASACTAGTFLGGAYDLAVDGAGNLWAAGDSANGNLMALTPAGAPMVCDLGTNVATSKALTIDTAGYIWIASNSAANVYRYDPNASSYTTWPTLHVPYAIAADGVGNVFYTSVSGTEVDEFANAATAVTPATARKVGAVGSGPFYLSADTAGNVWVLQTASSGSLYQVYPSTTTTAGNYYNGFQSSIVASTSASGDTGHITNPYGIAAGLNRKMALINGSNTASSVSNTLSLVTPASTAGQAVTITDSAQYAAGNSWGRGLAADGAGNLWTVSSSSSGGNYVTGATSPAQYMINEFSATGAAISPTGTLTSSNKPTGGYQKDSTIFPTAKYPNGPRSVAIDPTGNVWIGNNSTDGSGTGVVELVGSAAPVITPIAAALAAGASTGNGSSMP
ncbi:hypothetical protein ACFQBQ_01025 [Granulicella cerasi]|uniref:Streptogramin lyase n=1 Tax=Granulicella cerasi TaxID=741063 RepID=A0ABW1Z4X0_9BACT|nr:hypothetical protein [Granulicella cerasi]